jgi:hypothetical protein
MAASSINQGLRARDGIWLLGAVLAHGLLLLIPPESTPRPATAPIVSVSITRPQPVRRQAEAVTPAPELMQTPATSRQASEPMPATADQEATPAQREEAPAQAELSVARLLDTVASLPATPEAQAPPRRLGVAPPLIVPDNWRPRIAAEPNRFDGMTVPAKPEVLDRWLAADGSHNVVVDAPDGRTYCGRAEAWDPMRPLVEPVMMFRICAGGGRRDLDLSWFERRRNDREGVETVRTLR